MRRDYTALPKGAILATIGALILYLQNYDNQADLSLEKQPDMNAIEDYYMETGGNFWLVVTDDDMVVGTIGLLVKEQVGVLKKFFVH